LTVRVTRGLLVLLLLAAVSLTACGDDDSTASGADDPGTTAPSVSVPASALPPLDTLTESNVTGLQELYGPALAPLDLVVTRGGLTEFRGGTHMQLYVEPTTGEDENGPQVYLDRILASYQALLPLLFDAYPELDSFDICQEVVPAPDAGPAGYEEPVTLLLVTRQGFETVDDWSSATLADLFAATTEALGGHLYAEPDVAALPDYEAAAGDA
jgi:predicted small secreted protein